MTDDVERRRSLAVRAAEAGGAVANRHFRTDITVETKDGKTDVVTRADREAQRRVIEVIREAYPDDVIVGEEDDELKRVPDEGAAWVIDPIDGTNNFVRGVPMWTTSVAATMDGEPVAGVSAMPALGDLYVAGDGTARMNEDPVTVSEEGDTDRFVVVPTIWWPRDRRDEYAGATRAILHRFGDMRRYGSAQAVLAMVATGSVEAAITNVAANPWDTVAGVHLVRKAGGEVTDLEGNRWRHDSVGLVASNGTAHEEVLAAAREIEREE